MRNRYNNFQVKGRGHWKEYVKTFIAHIFVKDGRLDIYQNYTRPVLHTAWFNALSQPFLFTQNWNAIQTKKFMFYRRLLLT